MLISKSRSALSWILANLKSVAAFDEQISEICQSLESVSGRLNDLAENRFPIKLDPKIAEDIKASREIGKGQRHRLIYCSPRMHAVVGQVERAARREIPILIVGETGVGKELIARFIHISSNRRRGKLVPVNCAAIPHELFESWLFGHKQGAFTGAQQGSVGIIRAAAGGTLFLDEIGEIPLDLQPKLLRFLQEGEVHTVGENHVTDADVRVIASTNRNLEDEVKAGRFRADLLHRLNIISFVIPPLCERREDIPLLLNYYLELYSGRSGNHHVQFAPNTIDCLTSYEWPGNVRELSSFVLRTVSLAEEDTIILPVDLPSEMTIRRNPQLHNTSQNRPDLTLTEAVNILERQKVYEALDQNDWNYSRAAERLGLSTYGLRKKYRKLFGSGLA